jgi:prepilin-type N-terminal cleavage/methylation domain-containing protein
MRDYRGWTFVELLVVMALIAVAILIGAISVYRGKAAADQLTCQDNMRSIHSALEVYYIKNNRTYPANQAAFDQFLQTQSGAYFGGTEPRCPLDSAGTYHYRYSYNATTGVTTITCPVANSGHGSL